MRSLATLAIAAVGVVAAALPASASAAQAPSDTVLAWPTGAGQAATYTVDFRAPGPYSAPTTITLRSGSVTFPLRPSDYFIASRPSFDAVPSAVAGSGHTVTLSVPASVSAGMGLALDISGLHNPGRPGTYVLTVGTGGSTAKGAFRVVPAAAVADPPADAPWPAQSACGDSIRQEEAAPCTRQVLGAIDRARAQEGLPPMLLPAYYPYLTIPEQVLVVTDLERQARGLPIFPGLSKALDAMAQRGAEAQTDPAGPAGASWAGNWAYTDTPLMADFMWMYYDGPGGGNLDCRPADMTGCWGHRQDILGNYGPSPAMGAGFVPEGPEGRQGPAMSLTQLFTAGTPSLARTVWRVPGGALDVTPADSWPR